MPTDPMSAAEHQTAGNALLREGFVDEAINAYDLALEVATDAPTRGAVLCNRSAAYMKVEQFAEAASDALRAVDLDPALVKPRYRYACALSALGRVREAVAACDAGLAIAPTNAQLAALHPVAKKRSRRRQAPTAKKARAFIR